MISSFTLIRLPTDLTVIAPSDPRLADSGKPVKRCRLSFSTNKCSTCDVFIAWVDFAMLFTVFPLREAERRRLLNFISALPHDLAIWNFVYSMNFSISFLLSLSSLCVCSACLCGTMRMLVTQWDVTSWRRRKIHFHHWYDHRRNSITMETTDMKDDKKRI